MRVLYTTDQNSYNVRRLFNRIYYSLRPLIPRDMQIWMRRNAVGRRRMRYTDVWPINQACAANPPLWRGWPDGKRFALVLTHDVETGIGHEKCRDLAQMEHELGFRSSFYFVPRRYEISPALRDWLAGLGFEVGVHGLYHDGKKYNSLRIFQRRARIINQYLKEWNAVGFRSPSMHCNLDWIHELDIDYDASTFDTDPFEPQAEGARTIFPFVVSSEPRNSEYIELPYTLPQDFTLFVLMNEKNTDIWKAKLEWIAENGGMALMNTHPDYMNFSNRPSPSDQYPASLYVDFLRYIQETYRDQYWHALPAEVAGFVKREHQLRRQDKENGKLGPD